MAYNIGDIMKKVGEIFECYSKCLYGFLLVKRINPNSSFIHKKTKVKCYVYEVDEKLISALKEWKNTKPQS